MRVLLILCLFGILFLTGCRGPGTPVFNREGNVSGSVSVENPASATVYDKGGLNVGHVQGTLVSDRNGTRRGTVLANGTTEIYDRAGRSMGTIRGGVNCFDHSGRHVGRLSADIDDEAAGGACLLLLLRNT